MGAPDTDPVLQVPADMCGPAMAALASDKQRVFAYLMGNGETNASKAARDAGYSDRSDAAKVAACRMMQNEGVLAAIREVSSLALIGLAPLAIGAAKAILMDKRHPAHARMVETVLDRTGHAAKTEHKVLVEHRADFAQLEEFARRLAVEQGLAADALLPSGKVQVIEHKPQGEVDG